MILFIPNHKYLVSRQWKIDDSALGEKTSHPTEGDNIA
jgi:hypothetical protein